MSALKTLGKESILSLIISAYNLSLSNQNQNKNESMQTNKQRNPEDVLFLGWFVAIFYLKKFLAHAMV